MFLDGTLFYWYNRERKLFKMSVKLIILKSGEQLIADAKELVEPDEKELRGYLLTSPHIVTSTQPILLTEDQHENDRSVEVSLSPWILLSADKEVVVTPDWVVTAVEPIKSVIKMYEEKVNGQSN